jgi:hypothetical protein
MVLGGLAAVFVVAAGSAFLLGEDDGESGIRGRVTSGCVRDGCPPLAPAVRHQVVLRWKEGCVLGFPSAECPQKRLPVVARFRSARDGTFRVQLPPGRYLISHNRKFPENGALNEVEVTVHSGEFQEVNLEYIFPMG